MKHRRRFKQTVSLRDRLGSFAQEMRTKAAIAATRLERDEYLKRARRADTAAHLDEWANSPGLQMPK
jgi:hypothetical protein